MPEPATSEPAPAAPATVLVPPGGWRPADVAEVWRARELVGYLAWRDVKVRYKQTALGASWAVLQPLAMMVVFAGVFGRMARLPSGGVPYPLFAFAGLLPWTFFAAAVAAAGQSVVGSERLITKVYFPRLAIPFAAVGACLVDLAVASAALAAMMAWYGIAPGPSMLLVPAMGALIAAAALGLGTLLAALNVAYRDFRYVIPFGLQLGMFATPSVYMEAGPAPAGPIGWAIALNPLAPMISGFRAAALGGAIPWGPLAWSALATLGLLAAACLYFRRVEAGFADVI